MAVIVETLADLVGDTPLVRLRKVTEGIACPVYAKLEYLNPGGSVKDRIALIMVQAAVRGEGIALAPPGLFRRELESGQLVRPFAIETDVGGYWLTRLKSRPSTPGMQAFRSWLLEAFQGHA